MILWLQMKLSNNLIEQLLFIYSIVHNGIGYFTSLYIAAQYKNIFTLLSA